MGKEREGTRNEGGDKEQGRGKPRPYNIRAWAKHPVAVLLWGHGEVANHDANLMCPSPSSGAEFTLECFLLEAGVALKAARFSR